MSNVKFKLQNIILKSNKYLDDHLGMMYRGDSFSYNKIKSAFTLKAGDFVEFFTYFNSFSIGKWKKYTNAGDIELNLVCKGKFKITMFGHYHDGAEILKEFYPSKEYDLKEKTEISLFVPRQIRATTVGFQIDVYDTEDENDEDFCFYSGYWSTIVDDSKINDVRISIVTVTFKKEDYITSNIKILERELFYTDEPAKDHIRVRIIDNDGGKVLDSESMISEYVHYSPNANVGGSGGYTRGMIESINDTEYNPTHVLLMDDDVIVLPESFIRTYSLLALVKKEYDERFVSGAMLFYERMDTQHEDVGYVHDDGSYGPNKHDMHLEQWDHVLENDEDFKYHKNSYAGWWYCCIPVKKIDRNHLPIPLFIRGDDVEFSLANNAEFLSLNGICIWHKGFANKFNANLELYMVHRNSLIIQAMSGICKGIDFMERIDGFFWKELKRLSYNNCELLLDAIEEFCNGPEFLYEPQGEAIMKAHAKKNEVMKPAVSEYPNIPIDFDSIYRMADKPLTKFQSAIYHKTRNGHRLPDFMLKNTIAVTAYDWFDDPAKQYLAKEILVVSPFDHTAYLRKRDKKRYRQLVKRRNRILSYYKCNKDKIEKSYQEAAKTLKTEKFWKKYLRME